MNYNTETEVWKDVQGYEGLYKVSSHGRIWNSKRNRMRTLANNKGYKMVALSKNGFKISHAVHRLVAIAFVENPENKREVNHIDEDKTNNFYLNLDWVTPKENSNWGTRNKRISEYVLANPVVRNNV